MGEVYRGLWRGSVVAVKKLHVSRAISLQRKFLSSVISLFMLSPCLVLFPLLSRRSVVTRTLVVTAVSCPK